MADQKKTELSVVLRAIDQATAPIKRVNAELARATAPARRFRETLEGTRIGRLTAGLKGFGGVLGVVGDVAKRIGSVFRDLLDKIPLLGAAVTGFVAGATAGLIHLVGKFDELGKKAAELGVSADWLAQMRYAARETGVDVEMLNGGMTQFAVNVGKARAGTGRLAAFLGGPNGVSPLLLKQLRAAKSNEEAFDLLAGAMAKLHDPAKRAALAQMAFGNARLAPLFAQGAEGLRTLRASYADLLGPQAGAVKASAAANDELTRLHASVDGAEAALVSGFAPALTVITKQLKEWFVNHRADVAEWAKKIGAELPGAVGKIADAIKSAVTWFKNAYTEAKKLIDELGGLKKIADFFSSGTKILSWGYKYSPVGMIRGASNGDDGSDTPDGAPAAQDPITAMVQRMQGIRAAIPAARGTPPTGAVAGAAVPVADSGDDQGEPAERERAVEGGFERMRAALFGRPDVTAQVRAAIAGGAPSSPQDVAAASSAIQQQSTAKITVDFTNAPRGTRVKTDPQSTANVDLSVGYNLLPGTP